MIRNFVILAAATAMLSISTLPARAGLLGTISKGVLVYKGAKALKKARDAAHQGTPLLEAARNAHRLAR